MIQMNRLVMSLKGFCSKKPFFAPTEGLWGFSGLAYDKSICDEIDALKRRGPEKAFIILYTNKCAHLFESWVDWSALDRITVEYYYQSKEKFITFLMPASNQCPKHLVKNGKASFRYIHYGSIKRIIDALGQPIVSTSANRTGFSPIVKKSQLKKQYPDIFIYPGRLGGKTRGSTIIDLLTKERLR